MPAPASPNTSTTERALADIDEVLKRCGATAAKPEVRTRSEEHAVGPAALNRDGSRWEPTHWVDVIDGNATSYKASVLACIERVATQRAYREAAAQITGHGVHDINALLGILIAIRQDIEAGVGQTIARQAEDEVFDDLVEMAAGIARSHDPIPAIVLAVSVLEQRIRGLADEHAVPVSKNNGLPRSFNDLVQDLKDAGVVSSNEVRLMNSWYGQRTSAAHGRFDEVIRAQVPRDIDGVRDFLQRHR